MHNKVPLIRLAVASAATLLFAVTAVATANEEVKYQVVFSPEPDHGSSHRGAAAPNGGSSDFKQYRRHVAGDISDILAADFNGDGYMDIAVIDPETKAFRVLLGDRKMTFKKEYEKKLKEIGKLLVGAADFNGDGKLDLAVENSKAKKYFTIFPGDGKGGFGKGKSVRAKGEPDTWFRDVGTCDVDNDGKPDVVGFIMRYGSNGTIVALRNRGNFKFDQIKKTDEKGLEGIVACDFNGDFCADFFASEILDDKIYFYKNNGSGGFSQGAVTNWSDMGSKIYAADLNGDGKPDLLGSGNYSGKMWCGFNKSDGKLQKLSRIGGSSTFDYGIAVYDFNRDGKPDIAAAETSGLSYYTGKTAGKFTQQPDLGPGMNFYTSGRGSFVCMGDFNRDKKMDIAGAQHFHSSSAKAADSNVAFFVAGQKPATLQISNLQFSRLSFFLMYVNVTGSVDYSGKDIELVYNSKGDLPTESAFIQFRVRVDLPWPMGDAYVYAKVAGDFLHKPGQQSGTLSFSFTLPTSVLIIGTLTPKVYVSDFYLWDNNLVRSNELD